MGRLNASDEWLIAEMKDCGGDAHTVNGMTGTFRAAVAYGYDHLDEYRALLRWYVLECRARRRPTAERINRKYDELSANVLKTDNMSL